MIEAWCHHYNAARPHMSLNYLTPSSFERSIFPCPRSPTELSSRNERLEDPGAAHALMRLFRD